MVELSYHYKRDSNLPRRTFIVSYDFALGDGFQNSVSVEVTAPNSITAEGIIRRSLHNNPRVIYFEFTLIREVELMWNPERGNYSAPTVRVPSEYNFALNVIHRF